MFNKKIICLGNWRYIFKYKHPLNNFIHTPNQIELFSMLGYSFCIENDFWLSINWITVKWLRKKGERPLHLFLLAHTCLFLLLGTRKVRIKMMRKSYWSRKRKKNIFRWNQEEGLILHSFVVVPLLHLMFRCAIESVPK